MCPAALPGAPAPHERGAAFSLERRLGDAWILEAYLVSHRDPEGPWVIFPDEMDPLPELLIDEVLGVLRDFPALLDDHHCQDDHDGEQPLLGPLPAERFDVARVLELGAGGVHRPQGGGDPDPDRLVLPDAVRAALHRVCEIYDPERCAHLDIQP